MNLAGLSRRPWLAASLSALLLCLSFPNPFFPYFFKAGPWISLVALVPLLAAVDGLGSARAFRLGYAAGALFFLVSLVWINNVGPMGWGAIPAWLALGLYCAVYPALFALGVSRGRRLGWKLPVLWVPALWTLLEYLRVHLFDGFPWMTLGSAQALNPSLLALARITGSAGLDFVAAFTAALLWLVLPGGAGLDKVSRRAGLATAAAIGVLLAWGHAWEGEAKGSIKAAVIQIDIDPDQPWDRAYRKEVMARFISYMDGARERGAQLMIWPETDFPGIYNRHPVEAGQVRAYAAEHDLTMIIGSNENNGFDRYYNSSYLVEPGTPEQVYRKRHLVMFGEYIPFRNVFPWFNQVVTRLGVIDFLRGNRAVIFESRLGKLAPQICWETVFDYPSREATQLGAELLVLQTYDGWFGKSAAPWYLASQAALRAVESGRWVARVATTGVSGFVDPSGRFHGLMNLGEKGFSVQKVEKLGGRTPFHRAGNWFIWLMILITMLSVRFRISWNGTVDSGDKRA